MAKPALIAVGLVLVAAGAGAAVYGVTRKPIGGKSDAWKASVGGAAEMVASDLRATRSAIHERAATLASVPQVEGAVVTDQATAKDMVVRGELAFHPQGGEVITLGQLLPDGSPDVLITDPDGAKPNLHKNSAELVGGKLEVSETVDVVPKSGAKHGYLAVARPVDLNAEVDKLTSAGVSGALDYGAGTVPVGKPSANAETDLFPISGLEMKVMLHAVVPPLSGGQMMPLVVGGGAGAFVGVILLVAGMVTGKRRDLGRDATQLSVPPVSGNSVVNLASGTPLAADQSGPIVIPPHGLPAGAVIGRWEIVRRLGSGGMADVYLAHARGDAGFEKLVALKVMHPFLARNQRAVEHFLDEARLAARVVHPNVVSIQDLGKIGDDYVIVMDYVDGVDLERLLAAGRAAQRLVPLDVALGILCRICDGLEAAHKATGSDGEPLNIIHRDVKSANVLVSKQGGVKVVDFGIAKAAKQSHLTVAGETKGTPSMMAPEQRVGEKVDVRADVYSVAAVGYEIVTGHGVNLDLAALAHLGVENWPHLPPPTSLRQGVPPELDKILLTAMAFERDRRPSDCIAFETQIEAVMKANGYAATDKDIARWVASELAYMTKSSSSNEQFPQA